MLEEIPLAVWVWLGAAGLFLMLWLASLGIRSWSGKLKVPAKKMDRCLWERRPLRKDSEKTRPPFGQVLLHLVAFWALANWPDLYRGYLPALLCLVGFAAYLALEMWRPGIHPWNVVLALLISGLGSLVGWATTESVVAFPFIPALLAILLTVAAGFSQYPARWVGLFDELRVLIQEVQNSNGKVRFEREELSREDRDPRPKKIGVIVRSMLLAPFEMTTVFFLIPAFLVVLAPPSRLLYVLPLIGILVAFLIIGPMHYSNRSFRSLRLLLKRMFSEGVSGFISWFVILLGLLRLLDVGYVTALLDEGPLTILLWILFVAYLISWLYLYWEGIGRAEAISSALEKSFTDDTGESTHIDAYGDGRVQATAAGKPALKMPVWDLFNRLAQGIVPKTGSCTISGEEEKGAQDRRRELWDLKKRLDFHLYGFRTVFFAVLVSVLLLVRQDEPHTALKNATTVPPSETFTLANVLSDARGPDPIYLLAASGGGTRAALYTAAALRGIHERGRLHRVLLFSGVSGGSVALASFLAERETLLDAPAWARGATDVGGQFSCDEKSGRLTPWDRNLCRVAYPFINDVFRGVGNLSLLRDPGISHLLQASVEGQIGGRTLSEVTDTGVVFNTSLAGTEKETTLSGLEAGGRLVLTNVREMIGEGLAEPAGEQHGDELEFPFYGLYGSDVTLARASAISANFPPVFENVRIRMPNGRATSESFREFRVTDGGAVENRALLSLLIALQRALSELDEKTGRGTQLPEGPDIRILVVDASLVDPDYSETTRGLSASFAALGKIANLSIRGLLEDCREKYGQRGSITLHDLPMPLQLRQKGSFGTHWRVPPTVKIRAPSADSDSVVTWRDKELIRRIDGLFRAADPNQDLNFNGIRPGAALDCALGTARGQECPQEDIRKNASSWLSAPSMDLWARHWKSSYAAHR